VIGPQGSLRVFAHKAPCDMRKSFNTLRGLVLATGRDVTTGDVLLFVGKSRKRAKVLWCDGTGLCLYSKRLEKGRFAQLWGDETLELTMAELHLFLEGSSLIGKIRVSPDQLCLKCLTKHVDHASISHAEAGADSRR